MGMLNRGLNCIKSNLGNWSIGYFALAYYSLFSFSLSILFLSHPDASLVVLTQGRSFLSIPQRGVLWPLRPFPVFQPCLPHNSRI